MSYCCLRSTCLEYDNVQQHRCPVLCQGYLIDYLVSWTALYDIVHLCVCVYVCGGGYVHKCG